MSSGHGGTKRILHILKSQIGTVFLHIFRLNAVRRGRDRRGCACRPDPPALRRRVHRTRCNFSPNGIVIASKRTKSKLSVTDNNEYKLSLLPTIMN